MAVPPVASNNSSGSFADLDTEDLGFSTPAPAPPAESGVEVLRRQAGAGLSELTAWADTHRSELRAGSIVAVAAGLSVLLATGRIPGWRRVTSLRGVPPALLGSAARPLPVLLAGARRHGDAIALQVVHYPALHRLLDAGRGRPPHLFLQRSLRGGEAVEVYLAGAQQPTEGAMHWLRSLPRDELHTLRLLSIINAGDQSWTEAAHPKLSSPPEPAAPPSAAHAGGSDASDASASSDGGAESGASSVVPVEGASQDPRRHSLAGRELLWGELYAREQRTGLRQLLGIPARRRDAALHLIAQGEALMQEPIDLEWLDVGLERIDRLYSAEEAAQKQGRGVWLVRRPTLHEWTAGLWQSTRSGAGRAATAAARAVQSQAAGIAGAAGSAAGAAAGAASSTLQTVAGAAGSAGEAASAAARAAAWAAASAARSSAGAVQGAGPRAAVAAAAVSAAVQQAAAASSGTLAGAWGRLRSLVGKTPSHGPAAGSDSRRDAASRGGPESKAAGESAPGGEGRPKPPPP